jgi:hypothetical protein
MYLATTFTARMLSETGNSVDLIYRTPNAHFDVASDVNFGDKSRLQRVGSGNIGWLDKIDYVKFIITSVKVTRREKPDAIIGYNTLGFVAAYIASKVSPKSKLIYHNFDFDISTKGLGLLGRLLKRVELFAARSAYITIFPAPERAAKYSGMARLSRAPLSVLNCFPRFWPQQKTGELHAFLKSKNLFFEQLVIHLGSIDPFHGIEATIRSVLHWKGNWGLIVAGFSNGSYLEEMQKLVRFCEFGNMPL